MTDRIQVRLQWDGETAWLLEVDDQNNWHVPKAVDDDAEHRAWLAEAIADQIEVSLLTAPLPYVPGVHLRYACQATVAYPGSEVLTTAPGVAGRVY